MPRTKFIRSDGILQFIAHNNLEECTNIKYRPAEEIQSEYPLIEKIFKSAQFPETMLAGLTHVLEHAGMTVVGRGISRRGSEEIHSRARDPARQRSRHPPA